MKRGLALLITACLIIMCLLPMLPARAAGETIVVEAENYDAGSQAGDVWAAENDFGGNGWNASDWSNAAGIRFGGWGWCSYTFNVEKAGDYEIAGYAASLADNSGFFRLKVDEQQYYLYVSSGCGTPTQGALLNSEDAGDMAGAVMLSAGTHTLFLQIQGETATDAHWCYLDRMILRQKEAEPETTETEPTEPETTETEPTVPETTETVPAEPIMSATIELEAENYDAGSQAGDVWAAENDFGGNGWNAADWSKAEGSEKYGIRFGEIGRAHV